MGFGWLFIGYFITFMAQMNPYAVFVAPVGVAFLLFASRKLYDYCHKFNFLYIPSFVMLFGFVLRIVSSVSDIFSFPLPLNAFFDNGGYIIYFIGAIFFHIAMMLAIHDIAKKVELPNIAWKSIRNFIVFAVYSLIYLVSLLPLKTISEFNKLMAIPYIALWLAWIILNLILIFSCYARICREGDEDMPAKPSRIKLLNKMNDAIDKKQEQIKQSQKQYEMEKAKKKLEKQKSKRKK